MEFQKTLKCSDDTQDTGYRLYEWDGNVFLGYTTPGQPAGPLSFLVQLESTPH